MARKKDRMIQCWVCDGLGGLVIAGSGSGPVHNCGKCKGTGLIPSESNHGGKREGAGRKPAPAGTAKVSYATKIDPLVVDYFRSRENAAKTIEETVRRSKEFREWLKSKKRS